MAVRARLIVCSLVVLGTLLLQAAWILVMPPFGGMDEFDHAYRASAVGHGQLRGALEPAADGRGHYVDATEGVVRDAGPICREYDYLGPDNCDSGERAEDGRLTIASSSAVYPPPYYVSVGWLTRFVDGVAALYGMRILTALSSAFLVGVGCWIVAGAFTTRWPLLGLLLVLTPTALYTSVIVAPNALEMFASLAFWVCVLALLSDPTTASTRRLLLTALATALTVAIVRPFGPIWLFLILVASLLVLGQSRVRALYRDHRVIMTSATLLVASAAAACTGWVLLTEPHETRGDGLEGNRVLLTAGEVPLWFLQSIAAVPFRNTPSPIPVYVLGLALLGGVLILGLRQGGRLARAIGFIVLASLSVGCWYTYTRVLEQGFLWQGRYSWCLAMGAVLVACVSLDRASKTLSNRTLAMGMCAVTAIQVLALWRAYEREQWVERLAEAPTWVSASAPVAICIALGGCLAWAAAVHLFRPPEEAASMVLRQETKS